jgi:NADPH-dependent curcumin reductase CurA
LIKKHGFDDAINYKKHSDYDSFLKIIKEKCPKGVDKYFDNVGGYQTDVIVRCLNSFGRVTVCGQISQYNLETSEPFKFNLFELIYRSIRIEGIIVSSFILSDRFKNFVKDMTEWYGKGDIQAEETIFHGFEKIPEAFLSLFSGDKNGKVIIKV